MTILITGANGQVGQALQHHFKKISSLSDKWIALSHTQLDITNNHQLQQIIEDNEVHTIINTAAYTAVDGAENEKQQANNINHLGAAYLAKQCEKYNIRLIHLSTDYVFNGKKNHAYYEHDTTHPINYYGKTKLMGECAIQTYCSNYYIIRVSAVFSEYGHNFLKTILTLAKTQNSLNIINDQITCPTYAGSIAQLIEQLLIIAQDKKSTEIYHYCNQSAVSWYDFAKAILTQAKLDEQIHLNPIPSIAYQQAANRPKYSVLNCDKIQQTLAIKPSAWQDGVIQTINNLSNKKNT